MRGLDDLSLGAEVDDRLQVCALHGAYRPRDNEVGRPFSCRHCAVDELTVDSAEVRMRRAAQRRERLLDEAGLVGRFRAATFESYRAETEAQKAVVQCVRAYAETLGRSTTGGLFLIGPAGVGKSHLLSAMAQAAMFGRGLMAVRTTPRAIVRRMRATWAKGSPETEDDVVADLANHTQLLLIDEVGVGFGSEAELTQLLEVVDARYELRRPTCVASNLALPALRDALGDRIFDRLREGARVLPMAWPSYRGRIE